MISSLGMSLVMDEQLIPVDKRGLGPNFHNLVENKCNNNGRARSSGSCYICNLAGEQTSKGHRLRSIYGCDGCKRSYHVNCFSMAHNSGHYETISEYYCNRINCLLDVNKSYKSSDSDLTSTLHFQSNCAII